MKILKKVFSLILVVVMLIGIVPIIPVEVEAAGGKSLADLKRDYPTGSYWYDSFDNGTQCVGFARKMAYEVYGTYASKWSSHYSISKLKPGDIVKYFDLYTDSKNGHTVFVTQVSGSSIKVGECNWGGYCKVQWETRTINLNNVYSYTIFSAPYALNSGNVASHSIDSSYTTNFTAYPKAKITAENIFDENHNNLSSGHWIGTSDLCTIHEVYTDGCCKVTYPATNSTKTVYSKISLFNAQPNNHVDIGTNFTAPILNKEHWKIIENKNGVVQTANETGSANQLWWFERQSDGSYKIYSCQDGTCLDVYGAYSESGTKVQTYPSHDSDAQKWYIYEQSGGYVLKAKCTDCVLDLPSGDPTNGNQLQMWTKNDTSAQIWAIYTGDECKLSAPTLSVSAGSTVSNTTFTWNDVYGERCYDLYIWKNKADEGDAYHYKWGANSGYSLILPAGKYQAYVYTGHEFDDKRSNTVEFTVHPVYTIAHWFGMFENGEGNNGDKDQMLFGTNDYSSYKGSKITLDAGKALSTIPNGFYLRDTFGTPSISGEWDGYKMGTVVTQGANDMYIEYYYRPAEYKITYNLNGGTNSPANPSTYNVLYGVTLENPTREGYTFAGWTDASGRKVKGINLGENADFVTKSDCTYSYFCKVLALRTTGAQTLTANWIADSYSITYDANGGTGAPATQTKVHNESINISNTIPSRTGYTFLGWATDKSATEAEYLPGGEFNVNADTILYAVWEKGCPDSHNYETTITDPTCTENGFTTFLCIDCGDTYITDETKALGHSEVLVNYITSTCTEEGYTGDIICTTCKDVLEKGESITNLGHSYTIEILKVPTADTNGAYEANCSVCGDYVLATLPALNGTSYIIEEIATPSCEDDGLALYTLKDTTYGEIIIEVTTESIGHRYETTVTAPTCTEGGYTDHVCTLCGDSYIDSITVATGHSYSDGICTVCGAKYSGSSDETVHGSGDVNGDGVINSMDANTVKRILAGVITPTTEQLESADLNGDGELNGIDSNILSKIISGMN